MIDPKMARILELSGLQFAGINLGQHSAEVVVSLVELSSGNRFIGRAPKRNDPIVALKCACEDALNQANPSWRDIDNVYG